MKSLFRGVAVSAVTLLFAVGLATPASAAHATCDVTIEDVTKLEGDTGTTDFVFTVTATSHNETACDGAVIDYTTKDGTAIAGEDYTADEGTIVFNPESTNAGVTTRTGEIRILVIGDTVFEDDETFAVVLSPNPQNMKDVEFPGSGTTPADDPTPDSATGTIENDDVGIGATGAMVRDPESGKPGTVITVSGTECEGAETVDVFLVGQQGEQGAIADEATAEVAADNSWTTTLTVPAGADPDFEYSIIADCNGDLYDAQSFDVLGPADGYRMVAADGGVFVFGDRNFEGSLGDRRLNKPIVGGATNPDTFAGYWMVASDGGIFNFGDAGFYGSLGDQVLTSPVVEIEPTPSGKGYFLVDAAGRVFPFGDAPKDIPDARSINLNKSIIGMTVTPSGEGYWLVASDGGIFNFGDAPFYGSTGDRRLNAPIIDLGATPDGQGYYLVGADGGIFTFGTAEFKGSTGDIKLNKPAVAMLVAPTGAGYYIIASDGGVFTFGTVPFLGSTGDIVLNSPVLDAIL